MFSYVTAQGYTVCDDSSSLSPVIPIPEPIYCQPTINYYDVRKVLDSPGDDNISDLLWLLRFVYGNMPIVVNYYDRRSDYGYYDRSPDVLSIVSGAISDQTTSVTVNYHDARPNYETLLLSNVLEFIHDPIKLNYLRWYPESDDSNLLSSLFIPSQQHVNYTFIPGQQPASYIAEQWFTSNVIVPGFVNNTFIPASHIIVPGQHITVDGQQPASYIIASGQQTASHIIVPEQLPPIIGHRKRGMERTQYGQTQDSLPQFTLISH
ncbi:19580_t:CDS:2 [Dentiscutata erythropus]|uniref:19580_t:CDS:1 n=1 Tax=Dentiscutata erythropus TaxID=1348616 RepID=A0A9N9GCP0_9GLOM|nr:19580_t:CDS:2 [Dentiscutata erythropus]